jgi:hypothetical protein
MKNITPLIIPFVLASPAQATILLNINTSSPLSVPTSAGTAIFKAISPSDPAGSGVFDPFLSIQRLPANGGQQQGYNSDLDNFDIDRQAFNYEIKLSDLKVVTDGNSSYFNFLIDVNEPNSADKRQISLDSLKLYTNPNLVVPAITDVADLGNLGTLQFDLELGPDTFVTYEDVNQGSGKADIMLLIPTAAFNDADPNDYFYMYQKWGTLVDSSGPQIIDFRAHAGFEETAIGQGASYEPNNTVIPEPSSVAGLLGLLIGSAFFTRSRRRTTA